jgi:transcriptional regulator with XRE-family HTH domain
MEFSQFSRQLRMAKLVSKIDQYVITKVREKRLEKGFTQEALADGIGKSAGFIGKIESPKYSAHYNISHLNELAKFLSCSPQDFLPPKHL